MSTAVADAQRLDDLNRKWREASPGAAAFPIGTRADVTVSALCSFISSGEYGLREVPGLVREVLQNEYWHHGSRQFSDFPTFVEAHPPAGLGADVVTVRRLIQDDVELLDLFDKKTAGTHGGARSKIDIVNLEAREKQGRRHDGNDRVTALRRLRKERPDLHAKVLAGALTADGKRRYTPHGAMVEAGLRPRAYRLPLTVDGLVKAIRTHFTPEQIDAIAAALTEA